MRDEAAHHRGPVGHTDDAAVDAVGVGILDVFLELSLDHGELPHRRAELRQRDPAGRHPRIERRGVVIHDGEHFRFQDPGSAKRPRDDAEIAAVRHQDVILGILRLGEVRDVLVLQRRLAHQEGIEVGHHNGGAERLVQDVFGQHGHRVGLAAPDHATLLVEHGPGQARRRVREVGLVEAVLPDGDDGIVGLDFALDRDVLLDGAAERTLRDTLGRHLPHLPDLVGLRVGDRPGLLAQRLEALLDDGQPELVLHPPAALVLPPVEALEDARLHTVAGIILEDEELRPVQVLTGTQGLADALGLRQVVGGDRRDVLRLEVTDDLPVPHRERAELRGDDQDGHLECLEGLELPVGLAQELGKTTASASSGTGAPSPTGSRNSATSASSERSLTTCSSNSSSLPR